MNPGGGAQRRSPPRTCSRHRRRTSFPRVWPGLTPSVSRPNRPTRRLLKARSLFSRLAARRSRPESPPAPSRSASRAAGHSARRNRPHRTAKQSPPWWANMTTTRRPSPLSVRMKTIRRLNQRLLAPRRPRAGRASGTGNMRKARCSAASSPSATVTFHWKGRHGKSTATISPTLSAAFPPATKCGTTARAASQASTRIAIRFCGGWARGRCVQTPLHAFSTAVGLQGRTDNIQISLKGAVQDAKLCTTR